MQGSKTFTAQRQVCGERPSQAALALPPWAGLPRGLTHCEEGLLLPLTLHPGGGHDIQMQGQH